MRTWIIWHDGVMWVVDVDERRTGALSALFFRFPPDAEFERMERRNGKWIG